MYGLAENGMRLIAEIEGLTEELEVRDRDIKKLKAGWDAASKRRRSDG